MSWIRITAVQLCPGGTGHQDIERVRWIEDGTSAEHESSAAALVRWIMSGGDSAYVRAGSAQVTVRVVRGVVSHPRAHDGVAWTDHLLELPLFAGARRTAVTSSHGH